MVPGWFAFLLCARVLNDIHVVRGPCVAQALSLGLGPLLHPWPGPGPSPAGPVPSPGPRPGLRSGSAQALGLGPGTAQGLARSGLCPCIAPGPEPEEIPIAHWSKSRNSIENPAPSFETCTCDHLALADQRIRRRRVVV